MMQHPSRCRDRGAASAEYVGILVFVGALVAGLLVFTTGVSDALSSKTMQALCKIGVAGGMDAGCSNDDLPGYVPVECMVSSHEANAGGSVTIIISLGGDGTYELQKIRRRQDDGTWKDYYRVTTKYEGSLGYEFGVGGEVNTGDDKTSGGKQGKAGIKVNGTVGKTYEYESLEDAERAVEAWKDSNKPFFGGEGIKDPVLLESVSGGVKLSIKGEAGPASGEASLGTVVGYTTNKKTGDRSVSLVVNANVAAKIGVPLPDAYLKLGASGKASGEVGLQVTFDKDGNLVGTQVTMVGTGYGQAEVGADTDGAKGALNGKVENISLPLLDRNGDGRQWRMTVTTSFRNRDGSLDHSALDAASSALRGLVTQGRMPSESEVAAMREQINDRSQVTFDTYDYDEKRDDYGGKLKLGPVSIGGEVHIGTKDRQILDGKYWDPVNGTWNERMGCDA